MLGMMARGGAAGDQDPQPARRSAFGVAGPRGALLVAATVADVAILRTPRHAEGSVAIVLLAAAASGWLVYLEHRRPRLGIKIVAVAVGVVILASTVVPPRTSNDLWSYTMYGRTVTVHGRSPYDAAPATFPTDPFLKRVSPRWRDRASLYGPLFVGVAALGTLIAGDSALLSRLFFQVLAALALLAILVVAWRTTRRVAPIVFLGLNPVLAVIVVNGGHNDAYVGLAVLVAALLALEARGLASGAVIGLAALIKLTAGLALVGIVVWALRHHRKGLALKAGVAAAATVVFGYLPVLADASHVLGGADRTVTNASFWNPLVDRILHHDAWRNVPNPLATNDTLTTIFSLSLATVLVVGLSLAWLAARERSPEPAVGIPLAAYPLAAEYAFPWYAAWSMPVFAASALTPVAAVVWLQSVVMLAALKLPLRASGNALHATFRVLLTQVAPPLLLAAFVVAAWRQYRPRSSPPEAGDASRPPALSPSTAPGW
jgi:alpha-1,6-mannosyltransferase